MKKKKRGGEGKALWRRKPVGIDFNQDKILLLLGKTRSLKTSSKGRHRLSSIVNPAFSFISILEGKLS